MDDKRLCTLHADKLQPRTRRGSRPPGPVAVQSPLLVMSVNNGTSRGRGATRWIGRWRWQEMEGKRNGRRIDLVLSRSRWTAVVNDSRQEDCVGRFGSRRDQCCCHCKAVF